jgi:hypothetical protein
LTHGIETRYADVNGVHTYYEASGVGEPVVLLQSGRRFDPAHTRLDPSPQSVRWRSQPQ